MGKVRPHYKGVVSSLTLITLLYSIVFFVRLLDCQLVFVRVLVLLFILPFVPLLYSLLLTPLHVRLFRAFQ